MMGGRDRGVLSIAVCVAMVVTTASLAGQDGDAPRAEKAKRPTLVLRVNRTVGVGPMRVTLTADLTGGADDYQEFYCPSIEWDWGDGTEAGSSFDCEPYQPHISKIVRFFSIEHFFEEGEYKVRVRLKRAEKELASANANVVVR